MRGFAALLVLGAIGGAFWRVHALHQIAESGAPAAAGVAEDEKLFAELLAAGVLIPRADGGLDRLPEDFLLRQRAAGASLPPQEARRRDRQSELLKLYDHSAVGAIVRKQVELWNQTRRVVAIRDDRPRAGEEPRNEWRATNLKGRPLPPGAIVPETFGFIHDGRLTPGFSDWRTVADSPDRVHFLSEVSVTEPTTLTVQVIGTPETVPTGAEVKALELPFPDGCPAPARAHIVTIPLDPAAAPVALEITAAPSVNCASRMHGLSIGLIGDAAGAGQRYGFRPVKRSKPGSKFAIRTADGIHLTGETGTGRPTEDSFRLGLVPIVGTSAGDSFSLSGLLASSRLPAEGVTVDLTIRARHQAAAQEALAWGMARFPDDDQWAGERKGALVVLDAETGAILAAANYPFVPEGVHPWDYASFSQAFPLRDPSSIIAWEVVDKHNTPGSTFKPVVSVALMRKAREAPEFGSQARELMEGVPTAELGAKLGVPAGAGSYAPPGSTRSIKNFGGRSLASYQDTPLRDAACGPAIEDHNIGLRQMVKHSVNHWFARMAVMMEQPKIDAYVDRIAQSNGDAFAAPDLDIFRTARALGIDDKAPLDLASNVPAAFGLKRFRGVANDILYSQHSKNALGQMAFRKSQRGIRRLALFTAAQNGIGQSVSAAPLHMAQATAAIASGRRVRAHLLSRWGQHPLAPPEAPSLEVSPDLLALLHQGMKAVPENGTAAGAFREMTEFRCRTYGKTGTADVSKGAGYNTGWFVGWRDPEGPRQRRIAFACMTTHATGRYRFGGSACAPVVARMLASLEPQMEKAENR
ncbi:MAG: penicillin-binding transpeptidase domain-containing protein [Alphaproteobacteria bacterium]|nr:penicillin-binding transpeptidase domain-containing protein [Alphaproteobacteria bacterium]